MCDTTKTQNVCDRFDEPCWTLFTPLDTLKDATNLIHTQHPHTHTHIYIDEHLIRKDTQPTCMPIHPY